MITADDLNNYTRHTTQLSVVTLHCSGRKNEFHGRKNEFQFGQRINIPDVDILLNIAITKLLKDAY